MSDNESLVRTALESSLELNSLDRLARESELVFLLIDTSSSMDETIRKNGKRRIDALREVVADIKSKGDVTMIAFGGGYGEERVRFVDDVPEPGGGTPLHEAIPMAKTYGATRVVVISDGAPDLPGQCEDEAMKFGGRIDVVFVGDKGDSGEAFLAHLAKLTGGTTFAGDLGDTKLLGRQVIGLLEGEVDEHAPLTGAGFTTVEEPDEPEDDDDDEDCPLCPMTDGEHDDDCPNRDEDDDDDED